jgi:gas vesicle protein
MDVRKSLTDAGYIAVGIGVMGFQQAQVRRRRLQQHVGAAGSCLAHRGHELQEQVSAHGRRLDAKSREARDKAETTVTQTVSRVQGLASDLTSELTNRVEPVIVQVQSSAAELPERFAQAIEPVAARVRERFTSAA